MYRQRLADTDTPLSIFARLKQHQQAYLFESVEGGENWARYSIIGLGESTVFSPVMKVNSRFNMPMVRSKSKPVQTHSNIFATSKRSLKCRLKQTCLQLPSFTGGLVGYFGYDAVRYIEPKLNNVPEADPVGIPDIWMMLSKTVIVL